MHGSRRAPGGRARLRRPAQAPRHPRRHPVRPPQGRAGRQGRDRPPATSRRTCRTARTSRPRFDHHSSEADPRRRTARQPRDRRRAPTPPRAWSTTTSAAPSASRGIRGADGRRRQGRRRPVLRSTRSSTRSGWMLLNFLMDPRTGLGRFRDFRDLQLPADDAADRRLHRDCRSRRSSRRPDVAERVDALPRARRGAPRSRSAAAPTVHGNLVVLDLRDEEVIHPTNRFMLYALFPQCNISIHVLWGLRSRTPCSRPASRSSTAVEDQRRRADARLRRRRPRGGRHLPGRQRGRRRACCGELIEHDQRRRLACARSTSRSPPTSAI